MGVKVKLLELNLFSVENVRRFRSTFPLLYCPKFQSESLILPNSLIKTIDDKELGTRNFEFIRKSLTYKFLIKPKKEIDKAEVCQFSTYKNDN